MRKGQWRVAPVLALVLISAACSRVPATEPALGDRVRSDVQPTAWQILQLESYPVQLVLSVEGELPTPCHELDWSVSDPDSESNIRVELFSWSDPEEMCAEVIQPFEAIIGLGSYAAGSFTIWLNGERLEVVEIGGGPPADTGGMVRGEAMIESSDILLLESYPVQVYLLLSGSLPTPCHSLQWEVQEADTEGRILVEVYSLVDPEAICAQVLEPFEERIHLGDFTSGSFSVWVNGELRGDFDL